jgi:hypothetical protein
LHGHQVPARSVQAVHHDPQLLVFLQRQRHKVSTTSSPFTSWPSPKG